MKAIAFDKTSQWSSLTLVILLVGSSFAKYNRANCQAKHNAKGCSGDTVNFTICVTKGGSHNKYMKVLGDKDRNIYKTELNIQINTTQNNWFWNWKSSSRTEADVMFTIPSDFKFNSEVTLSFQISGSTWHKDTVSISEEDVQKKENKRTAHTPEPSVFSTPSSLSSSSTNSPLNSNATEITEQPTDDDDDDDDEDFVLLSATIIIVIVIGVVIVVIPTAVGVIAYGKKAHKPRPQLTNQTPEEEETILSNPVYGMSKDLGGQ